MVSEEVLVSNFSSLGCNVLPKSVIDQCLEICKTHSLNEESFVELWVSYSVAQCLDLDPTLDALIKLEKEELKSKIEAFVTKDAHTVPMIECSMDEEATDCNNVLDMYNTNQPVSSNAKRPGSPGIEIEKESKLRAVDHTFTPSTYTPTAKTPSRGRSTAVRGKVLLNFGPEIQTWQRQNDCDISILKSDNIRHIPKDAVYMYEMLSKQGNILSVSCENFGERLCHIWYSMGNPNSNVRYVRNVTSVSQVPFRTWGRISTVLDKSSGTKVVIIEGCKRSKGKNNAPTIRLDLSGLKRYSVFPGQIVAVEGTNTVGNVLMAKELFAKGYAPLPGTPKLSETLNVYVAVGPFTASDNLNYQPLWDLMECVVEEEPNILILVGPFVEYTHSEIKKGTIKDTFQEFFDKILTRIMKYVQGKCTRVVLVPSCRDAHHDPVFPTPEFTIVSNKIGSDTSNLYAMPDPCVINVEGLQIGITSVDSVKHLGQQEVSNTPGMDRLGRLADHVLSQATFYPLYPPHATSNIDTTLWKKHACYQQQPHIMILPSDIRYYCKVINECLVVNPERLQKYICAKLCIRPSIGGKWNPNNVACHIVKV